MIKKMTAIITGGGGCLGLATARKLLEKQWQVVVFDRPEAEKTISRELPETVTFCTGDIGSEDDFRNALTIVQSRFGGLHALVNCAGSNMARQVYNFNKDTCGDLPEFSEFVQSNITGVFNTVRLSAQLISKNIPEEDGLRGVIINTSGLYATDGQVGQCALSAVGGAISSMTLPMCRDLANAGIRVVTISPGLIKSNLTASLPKKVVEILEVCTPSPKRMGFPEEYANLAWSIIENKFINGTTIAMDGGLRMYLM